MFLCLIRLEILIKTTKHFSRNSYQPRLTDQPTQNCTKPTVKPARSAAACNLVCIFWIIDLLYLPATVTPYSDARGDVLTQPLAPQGGGDGTC